jgi:sporulation protein YlmC with PRC-barrel domain
MMLRLVSCDSLTLVRLDLGKPVRCSDDVFGVLADVVIDPVTKRVTHLVVRPERQDTIATRLVPIELAEEDEGGEAIWLRCTVDEAGKLDIVEEFAYLRLGESPARDPDWDVGIQEVLAPPFYEGTGFDDYAGELGTSEALIYDRVPKGEIEIRRSSPVYSSDGHHLGHVDGFVVDETDQIAQLVLERGHLWGRREVTVPIGAVASVANDEVKLSLSRDEVGALPAVRVHRWGAHGTASDS